MAILDEFAEIIKPNEPLAPYTYLRMGGPAEMLVQPRSREELSRFVRRCFQERVPLRVLGSGCNLLVRNDSPTCDPRFVSLSTMVDRRRCCGQ